MAQNGRPSASKRQKEQNRIEKRKRKAERKAQRGAEAEQQQPSAADHEQDPDIAFVVADQQLQNSD